nr:MAG TPA: hypothetical protein [Caudoviricetes sp.]
MVHILYILSLLVVYSKNTIFIVVIYTFKLINSLFCIYC